MVEIDAWSFLGATYCDPDLFFMSRLLFSPRPNPVFDSEGFRVGAVLSIVRGFVAVKLCYAYFTDLTEFDTCASLDKCLVGL